MAYYVNIELDLKVLDETKLKKAMEDNKDDFFELFDSIKVTNNIEFGEYYIPLDEDLLGKFFSTIAPYVLGTIYFDGEDKEHWAYEFYGNGKFDFKEATIFYGFDAYKTFIDYHGQELSDELKKQLEDWNVARKV